MDWLDQISNINFWAVSAATVTTFVVGALWYSWGVFGKTWAELVDLTKAEVEKTEPKVYIRTALGSFVAALVLAVLMQATGAGGPIEGLVFGLVIGLGFRITSHAMHNDFAHHSNRLTMIDGFHDVVQTGVMGLVIGLIA